jgi:hypothetical protein
MLKKTGIQEDPDPIEINQFVDPILRVVFQFAKQRFVFFSRLVMKMVLGHFINVNLNNSFITKIRVELRNGGGGGQVLRGDGS